MENAYLAMLEMLLRGFSRNRSISVKHNILHDAHQSRQ